MGVESDPQVVESKSIFQNPSQSLDWLMDYFTLPAGAQATRSFQGKPPTATDSQDAGLPASPPSNGRAIPGHDSISAYRHTDQV